MNVSDIIPLELQPQLTWLGKVPTGWFRTLPGNRPDGDSRPRTDIVCRPGMLDVVPGAAQNEFIITKIKDALKEHMMLTLAYIEAAGRMLADGPKLFCPNEEQWESMENVKITIPMGQFRTPYPAMAVRIPLGARRRIATRFGVDMNRFPNQTLIRLRREPDENIFLFMMSRFGDSELFHVMQDQEGNESIESTLNRKIDEDGHGFPTILNWTNGIDYTNTPRVV